MSQDILSDLLRAVRLRSAVFFHVRCGSEWAVQAPAASELAATVLPGAQHVMEYHVITRGAGWAAVLGEPPVRLSIGDIVIFPHGDAHVMSSAPGLPAPPFDLGWLQAHRHGPLPLRMDIVDPAPHAAARPDSATEVVCGFLGCDLRPFNPLVSHLPRILHLAAGEDRDWTVDTLHQAVLASRARRAGSDVMLERISEMLFVHAMRRYLECIPEQSGGWLGGLRDRYVGRALALLHERPAAGWTLDELGREVGLSRSALHERFVEFVGLPPMQYLTQWRMQLASNLLLTGNTTIVTIAQDLGYASESAFNRAFKRLTGMPPAAWRKQHSAGSHHDG